MRFYETMFILKSRLNQSEIEEKIQFFKDIIEKDGEIKGVLNMGMRNLAYKIKHEDRGYYYVIYFIAKPELIKELERNYRINEDVLRFICIKYESKQDKKMWQTLIDRANGKIETVKLTQNNARAPKRRRGRDDIPQTTQETTSVKVDEVNTTLSEPVNVENNNNTNPDDVSKSDGP